MSKISRRAALILILATLAFSIVSISLPVSALTAPTIKNQKTPWVDKAVGDKGDKVTVTGVNGEIPAGSNVILYWDSLTAWDGEQGKLNETAAKSSGNYEIWFKVPEATNGSHYVWIYSDSLETQASSKFEVVPKISLSPDAGLAGERITVKGYGFSGDDDVAVAGWANTATATAEDAGTGDGAEDEFQLDYWPVVAPITTVVAYTTQVEDTDFTVNYATGKITFKEDHEPASGKHVIVTYDYYAGISKTTTNDVGTFSKSITVPDPAPSVFTVWGVDEDGNIDTDTFDLGPVIELTPEEDTVGGKVRVRGRGFTPNSKIYSFGDTLQVNSSVQLWYTSIVDQCYVIDSPITIDSDGDFRMDIIIPGNPDQTKINDDYSIKVIDEGNANATADFEILGLAEITVEPDYGAQGETATISGFNFTNIADEDVTVTLGGVDVGIEPETASDGEFEEEFTILGAAGVKELMAAMTKYHINATVDFKVGLMIVIASPDDGPCGKLVTITGSGFSADKTWNATFGDITLFEDEAVTSLGTFTKQFYVPTVDVDTYTITVWDIDAEVEVTTEFEVDETTILDVDPPEAPNRAPNQPMYNVSIDGTDFLHLAGETVDFVLYNVTADGDIDEDWDMDVYQGDPGTAVVTDKNGDFEAWWELLDNETLSLGAYIINATQEGPDNEEEIIYQFDFDVVAESISIESRAPIYGIGDTVSFDMTSNWKETGSYIEIEDPDGDLYWETNALNTWVKVGIRRVAPYYSQTSGGNPMLLTSGAPLGTWSWAWYTSSDRELDTGTFEVEAAAADILAGRMDDLGEDITSISDDVSDLSDSIAGVKTDVAGIKSDVASAKSAADAAKSAADAAKNAVTDVADTASAAKSAADAAKSSSDAAKTAADEAKSASSGLSTLVYGAIAASLIAALAAIVSLMQISRRIAG